MHATRTTWEAQPSAVDEKGGMAPIVDFDGLYRAHAADVRRFALFLSGDPDIADDLVSETFVRLWCARGRVDLTTVRGYLFAIARNLFLQEQRHARRRAALDDQVADTRPGPDRLAGSRDHLRAVLAALQTLPDVDRAALLMRADQNLPYAEIAAALGITVTAAKVKVHRARLALGKLVPPSTPDKKKEHA